MSQHNIVHHLGALTTKFLWGFLITILTISSNLRKKFSSFADSFAAGMEAERNRIHTEELERVRIMQAELNALDLPVSLPEEEV